MSFAMIAVDSERISEYGFDPDTGTVYVRFRQDGKGWQYNGVPEYVWDQFVDASSKGRFIKEVLDHYDHGQADI
jgi:hypothetical protein